jgi:hypothetical protein
MLRSLPARLQKANVFSSEFACRAKHMVCTLGKTPRNFAEMYQSDDERVSFIPFRN